ncbi:hypothetical protein [Haliangium sp.]|uniref:hypothetical protein n=1 Tax=Haliangium sp. TaxID=2663208 RepID=UPI003D0A99E7
MLGRRAKDKSGNIGAVTSCRVCEDTARGPTLCNALWRIHTKIWQGRTPRFNVASQAVAKREWLIVADWLDEHHVGNQPDTEDTEREATLAWWKERECLL